MAHGQSDWLIVLGGGESPLHGEAASGSRSVLGQHEPHTTEEKRTTMQRVERPVMTTGLERIAAKAREERNLNSRRWLITSRRNSFGKVFNAHPERVGAGMRWADGA